MKKFIAAFTCVFVSVNGFPASQPQIPRVPISPEELKVFVDSTRSMRNLFGFLERTMTPAQYDEVVKLLKDNGVGPDSALAKMKVVDGKLKVDGITYLVGMPAIGEVSNGKSVWKYLREYSPAVNLKSLMAFLTNGNDKVAHGSLFFPFAQAEDAGTWPNNVKKAGKNLLGVASLAAWLMALMAAVVGTGGIINAAERGIWEAAREGGSKLIPVVIFLTLVGEGLAKLSARLWDSVSLVCKDGRLGVEYLNPGPKEFEEANSYIATLDRVSVTPYCKSEQLLGRLNQFLKGKAKALIDGGGNDQATKAAQ